ncbi:cell envelope integrity protein TolA [Dokdonella sp.]|uniref:cell envelope integrity protein TolA n=1 Tax=Dokdonella sp. TaxID=2291710 RepID=UPI002613F63D|nr:cell envelope integrity protein TolA [Dokdonella sp.]
MESFGDKARALALAIGLHLAVLLALLIGLWWTSESKPVVMPGPVIEATLVGPTAAPKSGARKPAPPKPAPEAKAEPPAPVPPKPEPKPEPPKPESKPEPKPQPPKETPAPVQKQDVVDQEKIAAIAQQKAEEQKKEQEAKQKQRQIELEQEQKEKEQREDKARKLKEEQLKQLADLRKQREAADKAAKQERDKLSKLESSNRVAAQDKPAQPEAEHEAPQAQTGAGGQDDDLTARYVAAVSAAVTQNWNRPDSAVAGLRCTLNIVQIPGGDVISVTVGSPCNADAPTRSSIEQAVMKAAPLPYQGYEKVFSRRFTLNFRYDG